MMAERLICSQYRSSFPRSLETGLTHDPIPVANNGVDFAE